MTRPIRPDEVVTTKVIPEEIIEIFNKLITENWNGHSAVVKQRDVLQEIRDIGLDVDEAFKRGWLDVEGKYMEQGWIVVYDKPAYNEDYPATFTFRPDTSQR